MLFAEELRALFPHAKVILTKRETEGWLKSMRHLLETGNALKTHRYALEYVTEQLHEFIAITDFINSRAFPDLSDAGLRKGYEEHNARMEREEGVVMLRPRDGWRGLCGVLECDVPVGIPYPRLNSHSSVLRQHVVRSVVKCVVKWYLLPLAICMLAMWYIMATPKLC